MLGRLKYLLGSITPNNKKDLILTISSNGVSIDINYGENEEPANVVNWSIDEFKEDESAIISAFNAVKLYYTDPKELFCLIHGTVVKIV